MLEFGKQDDIVISMSGGIDSTVCLYAAIQQNINASLFHARFNKPNAAHELSAVKRLSSDHNLYLEVADFTGITDIQYGFLPASVIALDELDSAVEFLTEDSVPATGFPIVMSVVSYYAQISGKSSSVFGIIKEQTADRNIGPAINNFSEMLSNFSPKAKEVSISTPMIQMDKPEVIKLGEELGVPFDKTWSCVSPQPMIEHHCGVCIQCSSRKKAFGESQVNDPTKYLKN